MTPFWLFNQISMLAPWQAMKSQTVTMRAVHETTAQSAASAESIAADSSWWSFERSLHECGEANEASKVSVAVVGATAGARVD